MALENVGGDECDTAGWKYGVLPTRHIIKKSTNTVRVGAGVVWSRVGTLASPWLGNLPLNAARFA